MTLYQELIAAGCQIDNHESDLYVKVTPESCAILKSWLLRLGYTDRRGAGVKTFRSRVDGELWFDVPFAYRPFWERKRSS